MRVGIVCPGRGSYTKSELGCLLKITQSQGAAPGEGLLERADRWRAGIGRTTLAELDGAKRFTARHLAGENAAALIYTGSALDAWSLPEGLEPVAVCGNSMGFYTALHVSGALSFEEGLRLVDTMGGFQKEGLIGGQVIVPVVDETWRPDDAARQAVAALLASLQEEGLKAFPSIELGGYLVLAGEDAALKRLLLEFPKSHRGKRDYPFQLLGHSAFHTPLMEETARRGQAALADLDLSAPRIPLVDGRGHVFEPCTTKPEELFSHTLQHQVTHPFNFTRAVRVMLREFAPKALLLLGPGDSLGGALGQILVGEGWQGLHDKQAFTARQESSSPLLFAWGRPQQRAQLEKVPAQG